MESQEASLGLSFLPGERGGCTLSARKQGPSVVRVWEGRGGRGVAGRGRAGVALTRGGLQKSHVSSVGSAGLAPASALGMGIWLQSEALLCFLFNYDGLGSYNSSFCWGSLGRGEAGLASLGLEGLHGGAWCSEPPSWFSGKGGAGVRGRTALVWGLGGGS